MLYSSLFDRTRLLLGTETMEQLARVQVILFGIGGVGSWCAESLIRSGITHLTLVDSDRVQASNINRQLHATTLTIGKNKTEVLKERLLQINPEAKIEALQKVYGIDTHPEFELEKFDYIIDAIDSLSNKIHLIRMATRTQAVFFSSMGASLKIDPGKIKVTEFWNVRGCPLGSRIRKMIRRGELPAKKFLCVYSEELLENRGSMESFKQQSQNEMGHETEENNTDHDWNLKKACINGTVAHITAIFGFTLAGLVIQDIYGTKKPG